MKKVIKKILDYILHLLFSTKDSRCILKKIDKYDIVSFDIFDTLIKRNVLNEKDIFKLVEIKIDSTFSVRSNFYQKRINAELNARKKLNKKEVSLNDIYQYIDMKEKDKIMNMEINTELNYCVKNPMLYDIYNYCTENNKRIIITSDMYLEKATIEKILHKNQYSFYDKMYLSSDTQKKKSNGDIFKVLNKEYNINNKRIIHIGDNAISDFLMAKINGVDAILLSNKIIDKKIFNKKIANESLDYNIIMSKIFNKEIYSNQLEFYSSAMLAPLIYGFTNELHKYIKKNDINKIFFLARDSKIMMDAYNNKFLDKNIKTNYMYISRKSITFASFSDDITLEEFEDRAESIIKRKRIGEMIKILELNEIKYNELLLKNNFNLAEYFYKLPYARKKELFDIIARDFQNFCNTQKIYFKKYLNRLEFNGKICLVDIGWKGTIQNKLIDFCRENKIQVEIYGYYMGIYDKKNDREGFLYCGAENNKYKIYNSVGFFEILFLNNDGSTLKYESVNDEIVPVKGNFEQNDKISALIEKIQHNSLNIIGEIEFYNYFNSKIAFNNYESCIIMPSLKFLKQIKELNFNDGEDYKLIENKNFIYYVFHPKEFKNDLINSYYKIGFMKCIFKIKFPYNDLLKRVYKMSREA